MRTLAARLGWKLDPPEPGIMNMYSAVSVSGLQDGVPVRIEVQLGSQTVTTLAYLMPPIEFPFAISHEGLVGTLANFLGHGDIRIGDPAFDDAFRVLSKDAAAVTRLLTPPVKAALRALSDQVHPMALRQFHVTEQGVSVHRPDRTASLEAAEWLYAEVPASVAVVRALQAARR